MLPTKSVYGYWPKSGEIDLVESLGNANLSCQGGAIGRQLAGQTLHWGPSTNQNRYSMTHWQKYIHYIICTSNLHVLMINQMNLLFFQD